MAENELIVTAGLNYEASEALIIKQLEQIQDKFNSKGGLKIDCRINEDTVKRLQSQLNGLTASNLNINVGSTGVDNVKQSMQNVASVINNTTSEVQNLSQSLADLESKYTKPIKAVVDQQNLVKAQETMAKLKSQLSELGEVSVQGFSGNNNGVERLEKMVATIKSKYGELKTLTFELGDNNLFRFLSGKFDNEGIRKQTEEITKFVDTYTTKLNSLKAKVGENFAPNISASVGEDINKTIVTFESFEKELAQLSQGSGSIEKLRTEFVALDGAVKNLGSLLRGGDTSLNQFTNAINNAQNFKNKLDALIVDFENLNAKSQESGTLFNSLAEAQQKLTNLQRTQDSEGYTENWVRQYQEVSVAIRQVTEDLKLAKKLEQQDVSSATQKQITALHEIANAYKEIQKHTQTLYSGTATDMEKGLAGAHIGEQNEIIKQARQRLESENLIDEAVEREIQNYRAITTEVELIAKSKRDAANAHKEDAEAQKAEANALREVGKVIQDNLRALEKFNNSSIVGKNKNNSLVSSQTSINSGLINQLSGLQESLVGNGTPENVARITARMAELSNQLRDAGFNSEALTQSLSNTNAEAALASKIQVLTNQINSFANANQKATTSLRLMRDGETTFAEGWQKIRTALSGNLDAAGLQRVVEQFRNFRGEADAAGLSVNRFFQSMQSQLRMVLQRWISLYAVVGYIRKMIENVKELDNAMINLRRVTDETDAAYSKFLQDASDMAKTMKTTTSSLVEQSYQWAKLGYDMKEALQLAQASTVFMKVADVDQDQALSNLVTSLKAYNIEATKTIEVVDKLDKLNNEYAVSASGLGQGLERSASAMAMTGNSLEETLAMLTGAGEITQNLENTGKILPLRNYIG